MAGSRKDREGGSEEDLFEDLDQFFAPLDEWPEEKAAAEERPGQAPPLEEVDPATVEAVEGDLEGLEIDIPDEEELVAEAATTAPGDEPGEPSAAPSELEDDLFEPEPDEVSLRDLELGDEELGVEEGEEPGLPGEPVAVGPTVEPGGEPPAGGEPDIEPESWDSGADEDWAAAAEAEPPEAISAATGGPDADETEAPGEEPPVTVDDLRAAPPEYVDLPGPGEEQPVLEEEASLESLEELEELPPPEGLGGEGEEVTGEMDRPPAPGEEQEAAAAEAAADHFAEGIPPEEIERDLLADLEQPGAQTVQIDDEAAAPAEPTPAEAAATAAASEPDAAPTWQEEGAQPVGDEEQEAVPPARGPIAGRNLVAAFASGIVLAAAVIALLYIGKGPFAVFAGIVILLGQAEFYAVMRTRGYRPATLLGLVAGAFIVAGAYLRGDAAVLLGLFMAMALGALWYMAGSPASRKETTVNVAATILGVVYVPVLASFAMLLLGLPGDLGRNLFLTVIGMTILYDVSAYGVGSWFGSRPLAPTISPSKSREGAIGATLIVLFVAFAVVPAIDPFTWQSAFGLGLVIAIAAPLGDLVESAFKRDLGVKDMGTILPGHGGVLDRIDAILFTAPAAYYFLRIIFF